MFWWEPLPETAFDSNYGSIYDVADQGVRYGTAVDAYAGVYIFEPEVVSTNGVNIVEPTTAGSVVNIVTAYDQARDQGYIMIQSITQNYFRNNIKKFIPYEYWRKDAQSIDEGGGEGSLENFVEVYALTLDEIKQAIDEFTELFDIDHCPPKYLRTIAEMLNYPLEAVDTVAVQRAQLKSAIEWYKSKGARQGFIAILYAFGYYTEVIPLWTQNTEDNPYEVFTETIPGVAAGNMPPNDYPLLIENGGTWFRSPHYGIRLKAIIGDKHARIYWDGLTEGEVPVTGELVATTPDSVITEFSGTVGYYPLLVGTVAGRTHVLGAPVTIDDDGFGGLSGTDGVSGAITGTIDYDTGDWTLDFANAPTYSGDIIFDYTFDFTSLVEEVGYHRAFYQCLDILTNAGAGIQYHFDNDEFWYMFRRLEFLRPVFAVLDWIEHGLEIYEAGPIPTEPDQIMSVNPVRSEKGWYLGYCDLDDIQYMRLDPRLLGTDMYALPQQLPGSASTANVNDSFPVGAVITEISDTLTHQWIYSGVQITVTIGAAPYLVMDNGEGALIGEDATVYGLIDYITGVWSLQFEGVNPDNPSNIVINYDYTTEVPPTDRSGVFPRGSTALPFPHLRNPQEGYCHPPEELFIDWYWLPEEPYTLPLTRDGMNLYPPAGPVPFIDHADFPSRGFTNALGQPGHANTFTRELGYALRPLSLLKVEVNPDPDAENWENQNTPWEVWTGPWENIGD